LELVLEASCKLRIAGQLRHGAEQTGGDLNLLSGIPWATATVTVGEMVETLVDSALSLSF